MAPVYKQTVFKPVNLLAGEQPVRSGIKCNVASCPKSKSLRVCARCKMTSYCSRECQTGDWKVHKLFCLNHQPNPDNPLPPVTLQVRQLHERLFADFREAHSMLLSSMLRYKIECAGGARTFDYSSRYVHVLSEFNEQDDFNPATAYQINTLLLADLESLKSQDNYKAFDMRLKVDDAAYRATKPEYQGLLVMAVRVQLPTEEIARYCCSLELMWDELQLSEGSQ